MRQLVVFQDLENMSYKDAWDLQTSVHQDLINKKLEFRKSGGVGIPVLPPMHRLFFVEHPPVFTLGKSGTTDHLLLPELELASHGFTFFRINRGGDITYHGPGQIVGYPIFDLEYFFTDVHRYVRSLEEAIIRTLGEYGIQGTRIQGYTGVWIPSDGEKPNRKICAIGVHLSRWVTLHGFAFNVKTDLTHFDHIVPCGIQDADKAVTSLEKELGRVVDFEEVKSVLRGKLAQVFDFEYTSNS